MKNAKQLIKFKTFYFLVVAFSFLFSIFSFSGAQAATLYFSPSSGTRTTGAVFPVHVYVSSTAQAMNAASGVVSFSRDTLEVTSISKTGSIFTLWVQEPSFANNIGTVNFEGIVLNPGFTGAAGRILTINFRVRAAGSASLSFSSDSVLANDGQGTDVLISSGNASFRLDETRSVVPPIVPPLETPRTPVAPAIPDAPQTPAAPQISSPTHPDINKWYSADDARFAWELPSGITAARLLANRAPRATPTVDYIPAVNSKELPDLADGIWYFHARLRNNAGWGASSHFRFQIDTEKPTRFEITEIERKDLTSPKVKFSFDAEDETSGIDHFQIQINQEPLQTWRSNVGEEQIIYESPTLPPGRHTLIAKAVDKAGNSLASVVEFNIQALSAPTITDYPKELTSGEMLVIRGGAHPSSQVSIWLERRNAEAKTQTIESNADGKFVLVVEESLESGIYKIWAKVIDPRGAKSERVELATIVIKTPALIQFGTWAINTLAIVVPLTALIIVLFGLIYYSWYKFALFRKKIRKETTETKSALQDAFKALKKEIEEQVAELDGEPGLSDGERKIYNNLKKSLKISERFIDTEIEDLEKEIGNHRKIKGDVS